MQRAPDGVSHEESVREPAAVMRAERANGEDLVTRAGKQDLRVSDMSVDHRAVGE